MPPPFLLLNLLYYSLGDMRGLSVRGIMEAQIIPHDKKPLPHLIGWPLLR
jgi:hypothetical protein